MKGAPLVTILIPNYNYSRYLGTCLESAVNQTYENLQVVFIDNHSTDGSYDIAMDFRSRYKDRIRIFRNMENMGAGPNCIKANRMMDPKTQCFIYLSSDDLFHPTMIERSMDIMEQHPSVGFVLVHRNAIDENDQITPEIPFYNCNCVIPGTQQMEVFMMAGVGVSTQCLRNKHAEHAAPHRGYQFEVAGDWYYNFVLACISDMGYIMDPLCTYRTHAGNVTNNAIRNLTNSVEHVLLIHAFNEIATHLGCQSVSARLQPAREKLGKMCLRYCTQLLHEGDSYTATRYLHLAPVLRRDIREDPSWQTLWRLVQLSPEECRQGLVEFEDANPQRRLVSYDPPEGSIIF